MTTSSRGPGESDSDFSPSPERSGASVTPPKHSRAPVTPSGTRPDPDATGDLHPDVARRKGVKGTRTGALWISLLAGILILVFLLVFILQNLDSITLELFGWDFSLPLGVALLFAAIAGAVIVALSGGLRILQLRHAANREHTLGTGR